MGRTLRDRLGRFAGSIGLGADKNNIPRDMSATPQEPTTQPDSGEQENQFAYLEAQQRYKIWTASQENQERKCAYCDGTFTPTEPQQAYCGGCMMREYEILDNTMNY